jgi:hypothetical protein
LFILPRFPLGSLGQSKKTLVDKALESFGVTTPLLRFYDVHSRCDNSDDSGNDSNEPADEDSESFSDSDDEDQETGSEPNNLLESSVPDVLLVLQKTNGKPVLNSHPYIITQ